eukprot:CAMPEP_0197289396 /NCGR_PEP_ID=MMETSP0890-20130614/6643_1 /TAXON_ID=44058 ORGANISM="Aureoumbra lagunensis, Strain CCMP1510" /NCGR_SAMPLE_ID=MMETSP0890 /ASSEMBLY_ACC=CAM_ASM_000533 /LENGTH=1155 /DNA_ID=CAMNT_0042760781 /DNA_START=116 /DNA_END=3580 /DNA_ORIENTATION=+
MLIKSIEDVGATLAWYPVKKSGGESMIALGTKEVIGSGFDDYGASLEIHKLELQDNEKKSKAQAKGKTTSRFASLTWSAQSSDTLPYGLIAGGMSDGNVDIWDPAKLLAGHPKSQVARVDNKQSGGPLHKGVVNSIQFNPHTSSAHLIASGGADCEVFVTAIDAPDKAPSVFVPAPPPNGAKHTAEVTTVAWNTQVSHILATGAANGMCVVWDLRQKRPWCELRDATRESVSDVCWNPNEGLHLATCSGNDADGHPVVRLWDLRSSTTMPLGTLSGHTQGILSMSWCPDDPSLLVSCGRDNRTLIWDFYQMKYVFELGANGEDILNNTANDEQNFTSPIASTTFSPSNNANSGFGGRGSTTESFFGSAISPSHNNMSRSGSGGGFGVASTSSELRRYQVAWSPTARALLATSSFDRKVQFFSMAGAPLKLKRRAPVWLQRPAGVALGFGGRLVRFSSSNKSNIRLCPIVDDAPLVKRSRTFENELSASEQSPDGLLDLCKKKSSANQTWEFMRLIFEQNAREQLLICLGYNPKKKEDNNELAPECEHHDQLATTNNLRTASAEDVFSMSYKNDNVTATTTNTHDDTDTNTVVSLINNNIPKEDTASPVDEAMSDFVKRSLLVGDFEAAVDKCLETNQLADALLVASCGGAELWEQTRMRYFEIATKNGKRPFLDVVSAIITNELAELVAKSELSKWRETLAVLATYGKSDEFAALCEQLGQRLEIEAQDNFAASLCYMCAVNLPKTLEFWIKELFKQRSSLKNDKSSLKQVDTLSLQELIERITVFTGRAPNFGGEKDNPALGKVLDTYATILANQGELNVAAKYCSGPQTQLLLHRLDVAANGFMNASSPIPFQILPIGPSPEITGKQPTPKQEATPNYATSNQQDYSITAFNQEQTQNYQLPTPWVAVLDQTSNRTYYANPQTGQTQWDPPEMPDYQQQTYQQQPATSYQQEQQTTSFQQQQTPVQYSTFTPQQQQPVEQFPQQQQPVEQFPQQKGNTLQQQSSSPQIGTGFQQQTKSLQQQSPAIGGGFQQQPPQSASFPMQQQQTYQAPTPAPEPEPAPTPVVPLNPEAVRAINDGFGQVRAFLNSVQVNGMERKQIAEIDKALDRLAEKMANNDVEAEVVDRLTSFVQALLRSDFHAASNEQLVLVNSAW